MKVLIVRLSSLGDVVHAMPAVQDIRAAHPEAVIDWVVEPAFAPLVRRVAGVRRVVEAPMQRWRRAWWSGATRAEWRAFKAQLRQESYDAVIDLQGVLGSALAARQARGTRFGLANRTEGEAYEPLAGWLADRAIRVAPRIHAVDRARVLAGAALGRAPEGPPKYGLNPKQRLFKTASPTVAFAHGASHDERLWPVEHWIQLGKRVIEAGWRIALPQGNEMEQTRAELIAAGLQYEKAFHVEVWPTMALDAALDRLALTQGVIGVDGGLSHLAVALDLPHVQLYNAPSAWRTGPQAGGQGHRHQVALEGRPPAVQAAWLAWSNVLVAAS
ncbi:lipopolysaccharide heptosyltransferase I [Piscinibacter sp.]|uniref:lipopolysaccharide heptosyltransferase I n=1 Tax=Piscinibacter sp. TaxID=1903157 RepID=UPI0039E53A63